MTNHKWIKKKYVKNDNSNQVISYEDDDYENNKTNNNEKPNFVNEFTCMYTTVPKKLQNQRKLIINMIKNLIRFFKFFFQFVSVLT